MFKNWLLLLLFLGAKGTFCQEPVSYDAAGIPVLLKNRASAVVRNMTTTLDLRSAENVVFTVRGATTILNKNGDRKAALF